MGAVEEELNVNVEEPTVAVEELAVAVEELDMMLEVPCNAEPVTVGTAEDAEASEELY